jgi:hypothetical protein
MRLLQKSQKNPPPLRTLWVLKVRVSVLDAIKDEDIDYTDIPEYGVTVFSHSVLLLTSRRLDGLKKIQAACFQGLIRANSSDAPRSASSVSKSA